MKLQNKAMLITYPDSLGHNLQDLSDVMDKYFKKAIGGIHLYQFFLQMVIVAFHQRDMMWLILNLVHGKMWKSQVNNII